MGLSSSIVWLNFGICSVNLCIILIYGCSRNSYTIHVACINCSNGYSTIICHISKLSNIATFNVGNTCKISINYTSFNGISTRLSKGYIQRAANTTQYLFAVQVKSFTIVDGCLISVGIKGTTRSLSEIHQTSYITSFIFCPNENVSSIASQDLFIICITNIQVDLYRIACFDTYIFLSSLYARKCCFSCCTRSKSSSRNQGQNKSCHGSQRYNLLRDLIQLYSLPINFTRSFACPHSGAGFLSGPVRLPRDSPPASALYVHDRVSGCARDWSNHPGLEICCGCIPPSDNVAMDHTSPLPLPNPGPVSVREHMGTCNQTM